LNADDPEETRKSPTIKKGIHREVDRWLSPGRNVESHRIEDVRNGVKSLVLYRQWEATDVLFKTRERKVWDGIIGKENRRRDRTSPYTTISRE